MMVALAKVGGGGGSGGTVVVSSEDGLGFLIFDLF